MNLFTFIETVLNEIDQKINKLILFHNIKEHQTIVQLFDNTKLRIIFCNTKICQTGYCNIYRKIPLIRIDVNSIQQKFSYVIDIVPFIYYTLVHELVHIYQSKNSIWKYAEKINNLKKLEHDAELYAVLYQFKINSVMSKLYTFKISYFTVNRKIIIKKAYKFGLSKEQILLFLNGTKINI
jgi:hypothetical protein